MWKDKTNRNLLVILIALAVVYTGSYWLKNGSSGSVVLTQDLVMIDTAQISHIKIDDPAGEIQLARQGGHWLLTTEDNVDVNAEHNRVRSMISALTRMVPSRVASRDPAKWRDYQVDSTGRRVQVYQGQDKTLDLIIGRSSMQGQRTFVSYVRPYQEDNVYVIENFSASSISANSANYRNKTVLDIPVDSIDLLRFTGVMPHDFSLRRSGDQWQLDGNPADSARTASYLNDLRRLTSSGFVDIGLPGPTDSPRSSLTISSRGMEEIELRLFGDSDGTQILHSSQNTDSYFADTAVINQLFVPPSAFLPEE